MSKILAIDFGLKRCGLAISDDTQTFAFGLKTIESKNLISEINALLLKEKITEIVIGEPKRMNLEDSHITQNVHLLQLELKKQFQQLAIKLFDERLTSKMASATIHAAGLTKKKREKKGLIDQVSATIILQDYLHSKERLY